MTVEGILQFRFKEVDEARNYLLEEINHNDLMSEKYKKTCKCLNYVEHLLSLVSTVTCCVSISAFASLVCVSVGITISTVRLTVFAITAETKSSKLAIKKKKHDRIVLLGKDKLNTIEVLTSKALIDWYVSRNEFVSVNNMLKEYSEIKEKIKSSM